MSAEPSIAVGTQGEYVSLRLIEPDGTFRTLLLAPPAARVFRDLIDDELATLDAPNKTATQLAREVIAKAARV